MKPVTRKGDLLRYGLLGAASFGLVFWQQLHWLEVAARLIGRDRIIFDEQPSWIRAISAGVAAIPWVIGAALLVFPGGAGDGCRSSRLPAHRF